MEYLFWEYFFGGEVNGIPSLGYFFEGMARGNPFRGYFFEGYSRAKLLPGYFLRGGGKVVYFLNGLIAEQFTNNEN